MAKVKDFILEVLSALAGGGSMNTPLEDNDVSSLLKENTKIIKKSNAFNENSELKLDSIYNFLVSNKESIKQKNTSANQKDTIAKQKITQSPISNLDNFFDRNGYIPVMVLNPDYEGDGGFDIDLPDRPKKRTPRRPTTRRPPTRPKNPKPNTRPGGRPSTGGPARTPRIPAGTKLPPGYTFNSAGRIIDQKTGRFAKTSEILELIKQSGKWAKYAKLLKFLGAAGVITEALIDPVTAMYIGESEQEVRKQLAGALGSIGGATLGAILGAAGITSIPGVGQTGVANVIGGIVGAVAGSLAGELLIESLVEYLFDNSDTASVRSEQPAFEENFNWQGDLNAVPQINETPEIPELKQNLIPENATPGLEPTSYEQSYYAESETPDNEYINVKAEKIDFVADVIKFIYNTVGDGSYFENGGMSSTENMMTASYSTGSPIMPGYMAPPVGGGVLPQEGTTPPAIDMPELSGNPSDAKSFLASISANRNREGDTSMLNDDFASRLAKLLKSAPAGIREGLGVGSAYRTPERQAQIIAENMPKYGFSSSDIAAWKSDVSSMGAVAAGSKWRSTFKSVGLTKWVGMPGGSKHQHGLAVDLTYNGAMLKAGSVPPNVLNWVHSNAGKFGLHFPMGHEPWHVEPVNAKADTKTEFANTDKPSTKNNTNQGDTRMGNSSGSSGGGSSSATKTTVTTGKTIAEKSTKTFATAKIPVPDNQNISAQPAPIVTSSTIDSPFETAGVDKPLVAMSITEQSIFEKSGLFA